jgi:hypothetical protein
MASTYSTNLKIELIGTGEQAGTWGTTTNTNLGTALEQAVVGKADVTMSSTTITLTLTNANTAQNARAIYLNLTGSPGGAAVLEVPAIQKPYIVKNGSDQQVTIKVSGQTGVAIPTGKTALVYNNGTDVVTAVDFIPEIATTTVDTTNIEVTNIKAKDGTAAGSIADSTGVVTLASSVLTTTDINGGTIDGAVIGGASAGAGSFTTLNTSGAVVFNDAGADVDFRVEGDTDANLLFVDASAESIGVGTSSPNLTSFQRAVTLGDGTGSTVRHAYEINGGQSSAESSIGDFNVYNKGTLVSRMLTVRGSADNSGVLTFYTSNAGTSAERMRITSAGDVGIGTNAPINELTFGPTTSIISPDTTDGSDSKRLRFCGGGADAVSRGSYVTVYGNEYSGGQGELTLVAGDAVGGNIVFYTGSAVERMRIDTSGNVGIGTTSPNYTSVGSSSRVLAVSSPTAGDGVAFLNLNGTRTGGGVDSCAAVNFFNNGTANPLAAIFGVRNATDTAGILTFRTNDTERMRIDSDGNVGIGTTSPDRKLVVLDSVDNNLPAAVITKTGLTGANSGLQVHTNEASASGGSFGFRVTSGSTYDSPTNEIIRVNQHGLCFNGDTTAADALDDYEEGTWTPVLQGSTTAGTYVYDTDRTNGIYIKIGKMVTVFGVYRVFSVTSAGTGDGRITGLPFTGAVIDTSWNRSPGILRVQAGPTLANNGYFCATESSNYLVMALQGVATWAAIQLLMKQLNYLPRTMQTDF